MMPTYIATSNTATGGIALGSAGSKVEIKRIIIGNPVVNANIYFFDSTTPGSITGGGLEAKLTLPATLATGQTPISIDFTDQAGSGMILNNGGNVIIDQSLQMTVFWGLTDEQATGV